MKQVTDQALFGKHIPSEQNNERIAAAPPSVNHQRKPEIAAAPVAKKESTGHEWVAFRIGQSLCLFDLDPQHFPTHAHKLRHLLKERGLSGDSNKIERDKVLAELRKQATALTEALKGFTP